MQGKTTQYRRRLITLAGCMATATLVVFLPFFLSQPALLPSLLGLINAHISGQLQVQSCSLHWISGLSCKGVQYRDPRFAIQMQLPQVRTDKGLLTLLLAPQYLGEITLTQPTLTVLSPSGMAPDTSAVPGRQAPAHRSPTSWWERWSLRLTIKQGRVVIDQGPHNPTQVLAGEVECSSDLSMGSLNYTLAFRGGETDGQLQAYGFINLPTAGQPFLSSLVAHATLEMQALEIEPLLDLAATRIPWLPRGKGRMDAVCRLRMAGMHQLDVDGDAALHGAALAGGFLGEDHPVFDHLRFRFQGSRHPEEGWRLTALDLQSEPLRFSAHGFLDHQRADFSGQGTIDLAQLAAQLPRLLALHEQTTIHQGHLDLAFQAAGSLEAIRFKADCQTDRLDVSQAGRPYSWESPLALHAEASSGPHGVRLTALRAEAPFLSVDGTGDVEDFSLRGTAELDRLLIELKKIFSLNLHAKGQLRFDLASQLVDGNQFRLTSRLNIDNFLLTVGGNPVLPSHALSLQGEATGVPWFLPWAGLQTLHVKAAGWPGELDLEADSIQGEMSGTDAGLPGPPDCRIKGRFDLNRLGTVVRLLHDQPSGPEIAGRLWFDASGQWNKTSLFIDQMQGEVLDFTIFSDSVPLLRESRVRLGLHDAPLALGPINLGELIVVGEQDALPPPEPAFCAVDLQTPRFEVRHLRLTGDGREVEVHWQVNHGQGDDADSMLELRGVGGLELVTSWGRQQGWLGPGMTLTGQTKAGGTARFHGKRLQTMEISAVVKDFAAVDGKKRLFADPRMELALYASPDTAADGIVNFSRLFLKMARFSFAGAGMAHTQKKSPLLEMRGALQPASAALASVADRLVPGGIAVTGGDTGEILLSMPLRLPIDIRQLTLTGRLPLEELRWRGVPLHGVCMPVELNRGILRLPTEARIGGGQVRLHPQWQWEDDGVLLTLPPESQVLRDVEVTRSLKAGLLHLLPPLGCLVSAKGTIDLAFNRFSLPTDGSRQADFAAVINLAKASPEAALALQEVLATAGLSEQPLRFKERELACEGRKGAITCAPLRLLAGDQAVTITGSMQRNGSLRYRIELPVTDHLAQQAHLMVHGEFTATAEITGNRLVPVFDRQAFLNALPPQLAAGLPQPLAVTAQQPETTPAPTSVVGPIAD